MHRYVLSHDNTSQSLHNARWSSPPGYHLADQNKIATDDRNKVELAKGVDKNRFRTFPNGKNAPCRMPRYAKICATISEKLGGGSA